MLNVTPVDVVVVVVDDAADEPPEDINAVDEPPPDAEPCLLYTSDAADE